MRILVKAIALPPSGLLRVGVVGLLCWRRRPRLGLALCAASIGGLWLLATPVFSDVLARAGEGYPALDPKHLTAAQARAQAIVILGQCPRGRRHAPLRGGELAARRALGRGSLEAASSDTHENAVFSARLLRQEGIERIILVTSSAHLKRAAAEFTAAGLEVTAAPAEMWTRDEPGALAFVPSLQALDRSRMAIYEWAGRIVR